jgi:hypothetical protein
MTDNRPPAILDEYGSPRRLGPRLFRLSLILILVVAAALLVKSDLFDRPIAVDDLKASIEIFNISSQWVVKSRVEEDDFEGVILVPEISFQVRNIGRQRLSFVFFLGVFRFLDNGKSIGEGYQMALEDSLGPQGESATITLRSGFGYRATSAEAFERNQREWRSSFVEVFVRSKGSKPIFYKSYFISRRIEGLGVDVKI